MSIYFMTKDKCKKKKERLTMAEADAAEGMTVLKNLTCFSSTLMALEWI